LITVIFFSANVSLANNENDFLDINMCFSRPIESLDDYATHIALAMGYFEEEGIKPTFEFATGATDPVKLLVTGHADIIFPDPAVIFTTVNKGIEDVQSIYATCPTYIFDIAVKSNSEINNAQDLIGKKVVLWSAGASVVADPMFYVLGVEPSKIEYVVSGSQRAQLVVRGQADGVLTWRMEIAEWPVKGLPIRRLGLYEELTFPSNSFVVSKRALEDPVKRDALIGYCKAVAKGSYFAEINPEAAAKISLQRFPNLGYKLDDAITIIEEGLDQFKAPEEGWGYHYINGWEEYQAALIACGILDNPIIIENHVTNKYISQINDWDREEVKMEALNWK
jgi:NitT/TauT family transport system substrate-binding protein